VSVPLHQDVLLALIEQRAGAVTGDLLTVLDRVRKRLAQLALDPAKLQGPELIKIIDEVLAEMAVAARRAVRAGSDKDAVAEMLDVRQKRVSFLSRALRAAQRPSLAKALLVLKGAQGLAQGLRGMISDELVRGQTDERRSQVQANQVLMWVPERDACARCLRYAGLRLLRRGDQFPGGLSFDPAQDTTDAPKLAGPPLHPHCRCELQTVTKGDSEQASQALVREANRSILKGFALDSESQASRRRAAEKLLGSGVQAPKSVKADARRRLRGDESFIRPVPDGSGT
jgi:hypothetical protein